MRVKIRFGTVGKRIICQLPPARGWCIDIKETGNQLNEGDNNDGITILSLDGTTKVKYCFMRVNNEPKRFEPLTPMSASDYVSEYYYRFKIENKIAYLDKHAQLLTFEEVREMYPQVYEGLDFETEELQNTPYDELPLHINNVTFENNKCIIERRLKGKAV